jgi:hypothetical protein
MFLQSYQCGNIYPVHEIERQKTLKADTKHHKSDNELEAKEGIVMGIPKRSSPAGKKFLLRNVEKEIECTIRILKLIERSNNMEKRMFMSSMILIHR